MSSGSPHASVTTPAGIAVRSEGRVGVLIDAGSAGSAGRAQQPRVRILSRPLLVGRHPVHDGFDGWMLADRLVSGRHATITPMGTGFELRDLGSRNGTLCDGNPVSAPVMLRDGAQLFFGSHAAVFRVVSDNALRALAEDVAQPFGPSSTASPDLATVLWRLRRLAPTGEDLLLAGETGVGKEVYAHAIHRASGRRGNLVAINCAAIPGELVESELFGYARGAHSQAVTSKAGLIEQADQGTLFLDEIGDMPPAAQAKLLRFLQDRQYTPLGATSPRRVDVRVVAATSHATASSVAPGLRADVAGRLGADPIVIPPLRQRPEDIGPLVATFLGEAARPIDPAAYFALLLHTWPRNVRELEKTMREARALSVGEEVIGLEHLPTALARKVDRKPTESTSSPTEASRVRRRSPRPLPEKAELEALLASHGGNVAEVARALDRQWAVVWRALDRHGIDVGEFRPPEGAGNADE